MPNYSFEKSFRSGVSSLNPGKPGDGESLQGRVFRSLSSSIRAIRSRDLKSTAVELTGFRFPASGEGQLALMASRELRWTEGGNSCSSVLKRQVTMFCGSVFQTQELFEDSTDTKAGWGIALISRFGSGDDRVILLELMNSRKLPGSCGVFPSGPKKAFHRNWYK